MVIEMREAAYNKVFDLLDEVKDLGKKKKLVLCELEDAIYECYESSKEEYESMDDEQYEDDDTDMNFRRYRGMRSSRGMRSHEGHEYDFDGETQMRGARFRGNMRRRNRIGQYM